jgi:transglutaminase-like putative cysteine protease
MWLNVEHVTRFSYDAPIAEAYTEVRLKPAHREGQRCSSFTLQTEPRGISVQEYRDRFGNTVHHFDVLEPHDALVLTARSEVWTPSGFEADEREPSPLDRWDLLRGTRYVPLEGAIAELAASVRERSGALETALALMEAVRSSMTYERGSTSVHTRGDEALEDGRGVCQDFAHVFIGACRVHGVPARYVSGYLHDRRSNGGQGASHGWVDVLADGRGWVSLDPTHSAEQTEHYVRVAVGRDYADVPPTRGVFKGNGSETLDVSVRVLDPAV